MLGLCAISISMSMLPLAAPTIHHGTVQYIHILPDRCIFSSSLSLLLVMCCACACAWLIDSILSFGMDVQKEALKAEG